MMHSQPAPYGGAYVVHKLGGREVEFWGWVYTRSVRALRSVHLHRTIISKTKNCIRVLLASLLSWKRS